MTTFDRQIAPLLVRLTRAERNESLLAERVKSAETRSVEVVKSIDLLAAQYPDVEMQDSLDGQWLLQPISPFQLQLWKARNRAIVETESPALAKAAQSAMVEVANIETQKSSLPQRTEVARRGQGARGSAEVPHVGWRRLLRRQSPKPPNANLDEVLKRVATLAETAHLIEQRQQEFQGLMLELQRLQQLLDECEAQAMK